MASLGTQLKLAREKRGATLDDVSSTTKIGTRMLRAIEEDQYDQLPGGIFNKGFVRAFAKAVGLDEEKAIADYLAATEPPPQSPEADQDSAMPNRVAELRAEAEPQDTGLSWGLLTILLLIAAVGFAGWGYYTRESRKTEPPASHPASQSPLVQTPPRAQAASTVNKAEDIPAPSAGKETSSATVVQPRPPANVTTQPAAAQSTEPKSEAAAATAVSQTNASDYFSVHLKVRNDCWLSISSDGRTVLQGTIAAPAFKAVRARNQIVVKAGNVGALDFEFNGQKLPSQGNNGEVKTLTFGSDGLEAIETASPTPSQP